MDGSTASRTGGMHTAFITIPFDSVRYVRFQRGGGQTHKQNKEAAINSVVCQTHYLPVHFDLLKLQLGYTLFLSSFTTRLQSLCNLYASTCISIRLNSFWISPVYVWVVFVTDYVFKKTKSRRRCIISSHYTPHKAQCEWGRWWEMIYSVFTGLSNHHCAASHDFIKAQGNHFILRLSNVSVMLVIFRL